MAAKRLFVSAPANHLLPEGAALIGEIIVEYSKLSGGCFLERKAQKEHGARETIDGHLRDGAEVLMIDDVATTGGSILKALEGIDGHGCCVRRALAMVDREEGAADNLAANGIQLAAIFKRSDFPEI